MTAPHSSTILFPELKRGDFIRVRTDLPDETRASGKDAMVVEDSPEGEEHVALIFGFDRSNEAQHVICVGRELWSKTELDPSSLDR